MQFTETEFWIFKGILIALCLIVFAFIVVVLGLALSKFNKWINDTPPPPPPPEEGEQPRNRRKPPPNKGYSEVKKGETGQSYAAKPTETSPQTTPQTPPQTTQNPTETQPQTAKKPTKL